MTFEQISRDLTNASAMISALAPCVENARDALRAFLPFALDADRQIRRQLTLRYQLKRKGRPGWKHLRPG